MYLRRFIDGNPFGIATEITFESKLGDDYIYLSVDECAKLVQRYYKFADNIEYHIEDIYGHCLAIVQKTQIIYCD